MSREPLTPEERALAERLAAGNARAEPGPALDARILAAARAAAEEPAPTHDAGPSLTPAPPVATGASRARRPRRRWSLGLGVAASLLLAVTLAWQLRPQRTTQVVYEEAPAAPSRLVSPSTSPPEPAAAADRVQAVAPSSAPASAPASAQTPAQAEPDAARRRATRKAAPPPLPAAVPPPPEAPFVAPAEQTKPLPQAAAGQAAPTPSADGTQTEAYSAAPAPPPASAVAQPPAPAPAADLYTPPAPPAPPAPAPNAVAPPPPPPPPAATQALSRKVERQAETADVQEDRRSQAGRAAPPAGEALGAAQATGAGDIPLPRTIDMPGDQTPAALERALAEDRALPPAQWLQRIRLHRFEGEGALARASLAAFVQAHPEQPIPEDLRALLP